MVTTRLLLLLLALLVLSPGTRAQDFQVQNPTYDSTVFSRSGSKITTNPSGVAKPDFSNATLPAALTNLNLQTRAACDAQVFTSGIAVSASGTTATRSDGGSWTAADIGKKLWLPGAGSGGAIFTPTITAFTDATHVTFSPAATDAINGSNAGINLATVVTAGDGTHSYTPGETMPISGGTGDAGQLTVYQTQAMSATVVSGGSGGTTGAVTIQLTTGYGPLAQFTGTISGGALSGALTLVTGATSGNAYTTNPASLSAEPVSALVGGAGLTGATVSVVMGVKTAYVSWGGSYSVAPSSPTSVGTGSITGQGATFTTTSRTYGYWGYGTDDTATIQGEVNTLGAAGGGQDNFSRYKKSACAITASIVNNSNNVYLIGTSPGAIPQQQGFLSNRLQSGGSVSSLVWFGAPGGIMWDIEPASANTQNLFGGGLIQMALIGLNEAGYGIYARSQQLGTYYAAVENCIVSCVDLGVSATPTHNSGTQRLNIPYLAVDNGGSLAAGNATGITIHGLGTSLPTATNVSLNYWGQLDVAIDGQGPAIDFQDSDGTVISELFLSSSNTTCVGYLRGASGGQQSTVRQSQVWFSEMNHPLCVELGSGPNFWNIEIGANGTPAPTIASGVGSNFAYQDNQGNIGGVMAIGGNTSGLPPPTAGAVTIYGNNQGTMNVNAAGEAAVFTSNGGGLNLIGRGNTNDWQVLDRSKTLALGLIQGQDNFTIPQGGFAFSSTGIGAQAAGTLWVGGLLSGTPSLGANGEADAYVSTVAGATIIGQGSTNDVSLINKNGTTACGVGTGTTLMSCGGLTVTGSASPTNGVYLPAASEVALIGNTKILFSIAGTGKGDYAVTNSGGWTFASTLFLPNLTAGSGTSALCLNATASQVETDTNTTVCGFSAAYTKNIAGRISFDDADVKLAALASDSNGAPFWRFKSAEYGNPDKVHVGLIADDVAKMDPRCGIYDKHGKLKNYEDRCVLAYVVADLAKLRAENAALRAQIARR